MSTKVFGGILNENFRGGVSPGQNGVFGLHPLMTPKYARNSGGRDNEFKETLARFYISLADLSSPVKHAYLNSFAAGSTEQRLAEVLVGTQENNGTGFVDFFLTQAQETFTEAMQVDKVLSDNYVAFFFGQEPPVFTYQGVLLNSIQDDQRTGFAIAYQHLLRGVKLARHNALVRLRYDSVIVSGVLINHTQTLNAENELAVPFSFSLLVKEYVVVPPPEATWVSNKQYLHLEEAFASADLLPGIGGVIDARVRTVIVDVPALHPDDGSAFSPEDGGTPVAAEAIVAAAATTAATTAEEAAAEERNKKYAAEVDDAATATHNEPDQYDKWDGVGAPD